jgi:hypothetical protein
MHEAEAKWKLMLRQLTYHLFVGLSEYYLASKEIYSLAGNEVSVRKITCVISGFRRV